MSRLALVLILLLGVSLVVAGCGGAPASPTAKPSPTAATSPVASPSATTPAATPTQQATATQPPTAGGSLADIIGKGVDIGPVKYDLVITAPGQQPTTGKVWMKGAWTPALKMRTEMDVEGDPIVNLLDVGAQTMYVYMPAQNTAYKVDFSEAPNTPMDDAEQIYPQYVGTEAIDGKLCDVYQYTNKDIQMKEWIWKEHYLPIRIQTTTSAGTGTQEYQNIQFGAIPDSMFQLPPGVTPVEFPSYPFDQGGGNFPSYPPG